MKTYIEDRVLNITNYMLSKNCTVRAAAKVFKMSKSSIYRDVSDRILLINPQKALEIKELLALNKEVRSIRGGEVTRLKYLKVMKC